MSRQQTTVTMHGIYMPDHGLLPLLISQSGQVKVKADMCATLKVDKHDRQLRKRMVLMCPFCS